ncbi:MAG: fibronectin type III domain-containing protein [Polyangiaceae bacterium]|nr:fibronectin type III domain-containing protein [Polyangiaceae bacterium]MCW5792250.1 fibronectin type III domain-containing protein [Polyangiaceae bacterium]
MFGALPSSLRRALALLGLTLASALHAAPAGAQTLTLNTTNYGRTPEVSRQNADLNKAIALSDCEADGRYSLYLQRTGPAASTLRVFVSTGNDCSVKDNRTRDKGCIEIHSQADNAANYTLDLYFRDIIAAHRTGSARCAAFDEACKQNACTDEDNGTRKTLTLWFMLDNSSDTAINQLSWDTSYDLAGPPAPAGVSAGIGEEQLTVSWRAPTDTDLASYRFYCDSAAGGGDGGGACTSAALVPGEVPSSEYECGSNSSRTATSGTVSGLTNFQEYVVGVSAVDNLGNAGPLSELVCATPEPVDDFFELYRRAGGKGGGGYCAMSPSQAPARPLGVVVGLGMLGWFLRRRAQREAR